MNTLTTAVDYLHFMLVKRGEFLDQGVDQPNIGLLHNAAHTSVESGALNHHITRTEPMNPGKINLDELDPLKFDVGNGFQHRGKYRATWPLIKQKHNDCCYVSLSFCKHHMMLLKNPICSHT